ncbi:MAG: DHA2 family efflux MFS transporter permease subunit, partial [Tumebacillaceae bacterium]
TFFSKKGKRKEVPASQVPNAHLMEGQTLGRRSLPLAEETPASDLGLIIDEQETQTPDTQLAVQEPMVPAAHATPTAAPVLSRTSRHGGGRDAQAAQTTSTTTAEQGALPARSGQPPKPPGDFKKPSPLLMLTIILAVFMAILDTSIVNVSLPKMMAVFGVGTTDIQWVLTAYTLVVGALVPVTGYLGDRFGYRKTFLIALVVFTAGSGLCGAAWSNQSMIIFRIIQAIGGGALMPVSMAMIFRMFPPERRGAAMGLFGIAVMFAPALGPTLSGYITEFSNWRLIFYINVPFGILDFFLALALLKEVGEPIKRRFDLWGFITSTIGFSTLLYGLGIIADKGWKDTEVWTYLIIAIISLVSFIAIELSVKEPMLDLRVLKNFYFTLSTVITMITSVVMFGTLFLLPVFLQNISGLSALNTGLILLPQALLTGVMMPIAGLLFDKFGARYLAIIGLLLTAFSLYLSHNLDINTSHSTLIMWLMIRAVGIGLMMMPIQTAGMNAVPRHHISQATAISNTARQVAASFGVAWLTVLLTQRSTEHTAINAAKLSMFDPVSTGALSHLQGMFASLGSQGSQIAGLKILSGQVQMTSTVQAMDDVFIAITWVTLFCILLAVFLKSGKNKAPKGSAPVIHE